MRILAKFIYSRRWIGLGIVGVIFLFSTSVWAAGRNPDFVKNIADKSVTSPLYVEGEVILKFKQDRLQMQTIVGQEKIQRTIRKVGAEKIKNLDSLGTILVASNRVSTKQLVAQLKRDPNVAYAEPNYWRYITSTPNDQGFGKLWGLSNTGQTLNRVTGTADADMDVSEAWDIGTGSGVTVAVIDTGVALQHPDLVANLVAGYDFVDDDAVPDDQNGHGTHVAGTIAAVMNNSVGSAGVAPSAKIMPLRVLNANGAGTSADIITAFDYAIAAGVKIVNGSFGSTQSSQAEYDAIARGKAAGVLFVFAAGNSSTNNDGVNSHTYPSDYDLDNIISVAATGQNDTLASFSNYGVTSVDVAAPGVNIYSTRPQILYEDFEDATVPVFTGTTFTGSGSANYWITYSGATTTFVSSDANVSPYTANASGAITSSSVDVSAATSVILTYTYQVEAETSALCVNDYLSVQVYTGSVWQEVAYYCGALQTGEEVLDITSLKNAILSVRFVWVTNATLSNYGGAQLDDIKILTTPTTSGTSYSFENGTSMAAPHVAGVAALLKSKNPNAIYSGLRSTIFNTVNALPTLSGVVATGGRVNALAALQSLDTIAPTATVSYSTTSPTNQSVVATITPSETITVTNNDGLLTKTFTTNGSFEFTFRDATGNTGTVTATVANIDTVAPTGTIAYSTTASTKGPVTATLTTSEVTTVTNNSAATTYSFTANGTFIFNFSDAAGNTGTAVATVANIDTTPPTDPVIFAAVSAGGSALTNGNTTTISQPYISWTSSDAVGVTGYYIIVSTDTASDPVNGTLQTVADFIPPVPATDGTYYIAVKAVDAAGNVSGAVKFTHVYQKVKSSVKIFSVSSSGTITLPNGKKTKKIQPFAGYAGKLFARKFVYSVAGDSLYIVAPMESNSKPLIRVYDAKGKLIANIAAIGGKPAKNGFTIATAIDPKNYDILMAVGVNSGVKKIEIYRFSKGKKPVKIQTFNSKQQSSVISFKTDSAFELYLATAVLGQKKTVSVWKLDQTTGLFASDAVQTKKVSVNAKAIKWPK